MKQSLFIQYESICVQYPRLYSRNLYGVVDIFYNLYGSINIIIYVIITSMLQ